MHTHIIGTYQRINTIVHTRCQIGSAAVDAVVIIDLRVITLVLRDRKRIVERTIDPDGADAGLMKRSDRRQIVPHRYVGTTEETAALQIEGGQPCTVTLRTGPAGTIYMTVTRL